MSDETENLHLHARRLLNDPALAVVLGALRADLMSELLSAPSSDVPMHVRVKQEIEALECVEKRLRGLAVRASPG